MKVFFLVICTLILYARSSEPSGSGDYDYDEEESHSVDAVCEKDSSGVCKNESKVVDVKRASSFPKDGSDFGVPQEVHSFLKSKVADLFSKTRVYLDEIGEDVRNRPSCRNKEAQCAIWALTGGCANFPPEVMKENCAPICQACHDGKPNKIEVETSSMPMM